MKAITVLQPFAYLIVAGFKTVENRTWSTQHRGTLLIHSGKNERYVRNESLMKDIGRIIGVDEDNLRDRLVYGALLGRCSVEACCKVQELVRGNWPGSGTWAEGPWCWLLRDAFELEKPVPWCGHQRLFDVPDEAFQTLRDYQLALEE